MISRFPVTVRSVCLRTACFDGYEFLSLSRLGLGDIHRAAGFTDSDEILENVDGLALVRIKLVRVFEIFAVLVVVFIGAAGHAAEFFE